jgi:hypothetical protein
MLLDCPTESALHVSTILYTEPQAIIFGTQILAAQAKSNQSVEISAFLVMFRAPFATFFICGILNFSNILSL